MKARTWQIVLGILAAALLVAFVVKVAGSPVSFDGAMNLQVAASLAEGHGYTRFYDTWTLFPMEVQTNAPFILPASLVFALFGVSLLSAQLVSIAYAVALVAVVIWLVRPAAGNIAALAAASLILVSPEFARFGANGYGEVPGLVWFLLGLGFFCRAFRNEQTKYYLAAGLCVGLAVITKTVMLMPVGILLALVGMTLIARLRWQPLTATSFAFAFPIAAFEGWRAASLGGVAGWAGWWAEQSSSILSQAGVRDRFENIPVWTDKVIAHAAILANDLSLPVSLLPVLALIPVGLALIAVVELKKPEPSRERILLVVTLAAAITAYFTWWLLVTPTQKAWHRRIFNGLLLLAIAAPLLFNEARRWLRKSPVPAIVAALPLLALSYSGLVNFKLFPTDTRWTAGREAVEFMRTAPENARFYGFGWYSAPVFSLYSGRRVHDLATWKHFIEPDIKAHYLLVDAYMLRAGAREQALRNLEHRTIVDRLPWAEIVEITRGFRLPPMPGFEPGELTDSVDFLQIQYRPVQGFHEPEGDGWRWVEPAARIALKWQTQHRLVVHGYAPSLTKYRILDSQEGVWLEASIGDCALGKRRIDHAGNFELAWSLDACLDPARETVMVTLRANAVVTGVYRQLSWIVHSIGFAEQKGSAAGMR